MWNEKGGESALASGRPAARPQAKGSLPLLVVSTATVAVAKDGRILWKQGFGWADRERRIPATEYNLEAAGNVTAIDHDHRPRHER